MEEHMAWVYLPGTGAHGHEHILPPSGKNCPVRGGFRSVWGDRRPYLVCNCYQYRELRFFLKITAQIALNNDGGG